MQRDFANHFDDLEIMLMISTEQSQRASRKRQVAVNMALAMTYLGTPPYW